MLISEAILRLKRMREELGRDAPLVTADGQPVRDFTAATPPAGEEWEPFWGWDDEGRWCIDRPLTRR
jgi:hypothetical protein